MSGLGRELVRSLAGTDLVPRLVADHPRPEWRLGAITVVIGAERAELRYARESVGRCKPSAPQIVAAVRRARARLDERSRAPDKLLPMLAAVYARLATRSGDRVALVAVREQLGGYTHAQFAWDLARLRRDRRLVVGDHRLDLGVATGHAAARRSRVVWIEDDRGGGAFYESMRLVTKER